MNGLWMGMAGMVVAAVAFTPWIRRMRRHIQEQALQLQAALQRAETRHNNDALHAELHALRHAEQEASATWREREAALQSHGEAALQSLLQQAHQMVGSSQRSAQEVGSAIHDLYGIEKTFERWHADMTVLLEHNRSMHAKNDEFSLIVRQMVMVALNASIEAARAGATGRGFSIVANEMRSLSARAEALSADYRRTLYENDLITTTTFQDMQAGGRMILGSVRGLDLTHRKGRDDITMPLEIA